MTVPDEMRALVWEGAKRLEVRSLPAPAPRGGWSTVAPTYTGICGSDLHIFAGEHPRARPGAILGHEFVGRLCAPAADLPAGAPVFVNPMLPCGQCPACRAGQAHTCPNMRAIGVDLPGGLAERVSVPNHSLHPLPDDLSLMAAALIEPVAVAVRAVHRGRVRSGDRVHVLGAGPIGLLVALVARAVGATVSVSEPAPSRQHAAARLGLDLREAPDPEARPDVVFDAAGHPPVAARSAAWARAGGRLVLVAAYPPAPTPFDLLGVMFNELTVIGSRIYTSADIQAAIGLLTRAALPVNELISAVVGLEQAAAAFEELQQGRAVKVLVDPQARAEAWQAR
jgi:(R,R)-butanediol dehydrogenase / meso-butanediol dehydrogenase / diacetyl reductase